MKKRKQIYTVSQVNSLIKVALEENLPSRLIIRGEISDFKHHTSGHCYFSLKDESGILPCVMWASKFRSVKFSPEDGMAVLATGHIDVYTVGGKYQLYVDKLEPEGVGALQLAFEQMVKKLQAEGLFDDVHKKPIPTYPERIGILTSESGAAVHDIIDSIHYRWPCVKLFFYPVPVQGKGAAEKIAAALRDINRRNKELKLDVLIVGRGGGALEDLWAFNEEVLARAIFDSKIPVISAVGHEVDVTVADFVADARASTPTKAGVVAVPDMQEVLGQLISMERRLTGQTKARVKLAQQKLEIILANAVFRNPLLLVQNSRQQLDELSAELAETIKELLAGAREKLSAAYEQIVRIEPHRLLGSKRDELNNWQNRMNVGISVIINNSRMQLTAQANRLAGLNPKSVLQRGYSITTNKKTGLVVRTLEDVRIGDRLITELAEENLIESKVTKK
ncbi:MAG: exodeoxyribonuclease VII large subunit [Planctomycetes bacterium]|nr:exodeoxyribonuclease VII large subunit [Planctomycetota bacterium]